MVDAQNRSQQFLLPVIAVIVAQVVVGVVAGPFGAATVLIGGVFLWAPATLLLLGFAKTIARSSLSRAGVAQVVIWLLSLLVGGLLFALFDAATGGGSPWVVMSTWWLTQWPYAMLGAVSGVTAVALRHRIRR